MEKQMKVVNGQPLMGSRGIANAVDKEHKQVVRDIKTMLNNLESTVQIYTMMNLKDF